MPTPNKNEVVLFTDDELPTAEAEVLSAIEKVLRQPNPNLLAIPMAILSVEMSWRTNLRQTTEAKSFEASQSLKALQEKEQNARNRFPDQAIAAQPEQLITLQQQLREEMASIASQRADLETKRNQTQNDLQILFADLDKGEKLSALFQKPAITNTNIPLSRPTVNALSRLFTVSPMKEETTLVLSPGQDLLTTARDTIAASRTRALTSSDDAITIEVQKRHVGRPNLSGKPTPIHFKALAILREEGVDLSELVDSTNAQGITMALKALLRKDVGIEPTVEEMEQALRGIVRGEYKEVLDNRKTLLALNGLAKQKPTPVDIAVTDEPDPLVASNEEITPVTKAVGRDGQPFDPKPKKRAVLDLAILTDALTFDRNGVWKTRDLVSFSELATDQRLAKEQGRAGNKRRDRKGVFDDVQNDFSKTVSTIIKLADKIGDQTIEQMLNSKTLEIPETQRQKLLPFAAVPVDQLPKVLDAIKMRGGQTNVLKPVNQQTLLDFLLSKDTKSK